VMPLYEGGDVYSIMEKGIIPEKDVARITW
jgi:hypothetical protein